MPTTANKKTSAKPKLSKGKINWRNPKVFVPVVLLVAILGGIVTYRSFAARNTYRPDKWASYSGCKLTQINNNLSGPKSSVAVYGCHVNSTGNNTSYIYPRRPGVLTSAGRKKVCLWGKPRPLATTTLRILNGTTSIATSSTSTKSQIGPSYTTSNPRELNCVTYSRSTNHVLKVKVSSYGDITFSAIVLSDL